MKIDGVHYRSIAVNDDGWSVRIFDQRQLPWKLEHVKLTEMEQAARAISEMWTRGAPLLAATGIYGLCLALRKDASDENLEAAYKTLLATRPTAVNLRWALDEMVAAVKSFQGEERIAALQEVAEKYGSTSSGLWAEINQAHELARAGKTDESLKKYQEIKKDIGDEEALSPLITLGIAQLYEKKEAFSEAAREYDQLKIAKGYESIGYLGAARILELQKNYDGALAVYKEYLNDFAASIEIGQKALVEAKITRIETVK
jgi:predicted negative regulator of RcsB-dependent stress response